MATAKTHKYRVNALSLNEEGHIRSRSFVMEFTDAQIVDPKTTTGLAAEEARRRYGDDTRLTRVHRW